MGNVTELTADDGHVLGAYCAEPEGIPRGGIVVIQEIFGVNRHIREVCDDYASQGFRVLAPALFDRAERGLDLGYDETDIARGREVRASLGWNDPLLDVAAAARALAPSGRVGTIGYCWGGSVAWLSATRLDVACAVSYYGGQIVVFKDEHPNCPVMLHFGETDPMISAADVAQIKAAQPGIRLHTYPAGHGFNCTERRDYHAQSAELARARTLDFLAIQLG